MPSRRTRRSISRNYHHGDLRAQAMAVAKERLSGPDHSSFSLPEIARRLGVSHAALYRHFDGKKGLLAQLALEGYQRYGTMFERNTRGQTGRAALESAGRAYLRFARNERALFRAMFHPLLQDKKDLPELEVAAAQAYGMLVELVERLEPPPSTDFPPKVFIVVFWSALHGAAILENEGWLPGRSGLKRSEMARALPDCIAALLDA